MLLFLGSGAVFPLLRRLGGEGTISVNVSGPEGTLYAIGFAITGILVVRFWRELVAVVREQPSLWALPALALCSTVWSTDPGQSLRSAIALFGAMLFGAYFAIRFDTKSQLRVLSATLAVIIIVSVGSALIQPYVGIDRGVHAGAWRGVFSHKNLFGRISALAFATFTLLALYRYQTRVYSVLLAVTALSLVWLSQSRTALVVVAATLLFMSARPILRRVEIRSWMIAAALVIGIAALAALVWSQRTSVVQRDPESETFTGRTVLWAACLLKLSTRPLLGFGFDAFWNGRAGNQFDVWQVVGWPAPNSHDAFVDVALDLGVVGLAFFVIALVGVLRRTIRLYRNPALTPIEQAWPSTAVVFILLAFLTEGQLFLNHAYWMLFTSAAVGAARAGSRTEPHAGGHPGALIPRLGGGPT